MDSSVRRAVSECCLSDLCIENRPQIDSDTDEQHNRYSDSVRYLWLWGRQDRPSS